MLVRFLALWFLVAALAPPASAAVLVSFDPDTISAPCTETVFVEVVIDATATDLLASSWVFEFDPLIVNPVSVTAGSLVTGAACPYFLQWINATVIGDSIAVDVANLACSVAGPGAILRLEFEAVSDGISPIRCRGGQMRTGANVPIPFTCDEGSIHFACPVGVQRQAWGVVKSRY